MFVTSDNFDLTRHRDRYTRKIRWPENLIGGIAVHGTEWPGYQALAAFLYECALECGLLDQMRYASYHLDGETWSREIKPSSYIRLMAGKLVKAREAVGVIFRGDQDVPGARDDCIFFGGDGRRELNPSRGGPRLQQYHANFVFILKGDQSALACRLLKMAMHMIGAGYGYYFVRDELCKPMDYADGGSPSLDCNWFEYEESQEGVAWKAFKKSERLWSKGPPTLRDLYQINLISDRHTREPIGELGYLTEWIAAKPGRGQLEDIGQGRLLWSLTDAEMYDIRPLLNEAGLLLSCRDRVYRDLPYGRNRIIQPVPTDTDTTH
jgi:hypothetical protein